MSVVTLRFVIEGQNPDEDDLRATLAEHLTYNHGRLPFHTETLLRVIYDMFELEPVAEKTTISVTP